MSRAFEFETPPYSTGSGFLEEVLHDLSFRQKALPSRFLYDEAGSELFERITELPEYYLTRTEIALLKSWGPAIRETVPAGAAVVEFGSGASRKTELLLETLDPTYRSRYQVARCFRQLAVSSKGSPAFSCIPLLV